MNLFNSQIGRRPIRQVLSVGVSLLWVLVRCRIDTLLAKLLLWRFGAKVDDGLNVCGHLRCMNKGTMLIGRCVRINSGPERNFVGGDRHTNIWVGRGGRLDIRDEVGLSNCTIVVQKSVIIREGTLIGGGCDIYDNDFHELLPEDREAGCGNLCSQAIEIGPRAFVGAHSIILKGVTIGEGAVIGAGSLVTKNVPAFQIWAGRPAKYIRQLERRDDIGGRI